MGLMADGVEPAKLPTGGVVESLLEPGKVLGDAVTKTRGDASLGSAIDDARVDQGCQLGGRRRRPAAARGGLRDALCKFLNVSPVLGFLAVGLLLNQEGVFSENREVDQFCELGIQFLLFEMGLELSVSRLKALGKYAFGLG